MNKAIVSIVAAVTAGLGLTAVGTFANTSEAAQAAAPVTTVAAPVTTVTAPVTTVTAPVTTVAPAAPVVIDTMSPITSPDNGDWCAAGLDASSLDEFFAAPHGPLVGGDYQRAYRLPDDRVLWMMQDAFLNINGTYVLAHNIGLIQSGKCFTLLAGSEGNHSWLMNDQTDGNNRWYWAMGGKVSADGTSLQIAVTEMVEHGDTYLSHVEPTGTYIVSINLADMTTTTAPAAWSSPALYGCSITSDSTYTYLYGWCYKQFGWGFLGADACEADVHLARQPRNADLGAPIEYRTAAGWSADPTAAIAVFGKANSGGDINPIEVTFDGVKFIAISKQGDWWGDNVSVYTADSAAGEWTLVASMPAAAKCAPDVCNTYWASLLPWRDATGDLIWSLSNNQWAIGISPVYRPSVHTATV